LFEPPLLKEAVTITHLVENIPDFQLPLAIDTLLDTMTRSTRNKAYTSYLVARQGQTPSQAKWMTAAAVQSMFPYLLMEAGALSDIKREELGQGGHLQNNHLGRLTQPRGQEGHLEELTHGAPNLIN